MNVIKRDGREDKFQKGKITLAVQKASDEVEKKRWGSNAADCNSDNRHRSI